MIQAGYEGARTTRMLAHGLSFNPYEMPTNLQAYPHPPAIYVKNAAKAGSASTLLEAVLRFRFLGDWLQLGKRLFDQVFREGGVWHLYRGPSKRLLPQVLSLLPRVDIFIHDSLHTYANMKSEFRAVWPVLRPGGILITDDIGENCAFQDFAKEVNDRFCAVFREQSKDSLFGMLVKES